MKSKLIHDRSILKEQDLLKLFLANLREQFPVVKCQNAVTEEIKGTSLYLYSLAFTQFAIDKISELCKQYSLTFIVACSNNKIFICVTKNVLL